jgi:hypothetical protein
MNFGRDDDISVTELLNVLEIDSAIYRLERVGFKTISSVQKHHLNRHRDHIVEDIFIEINDQNQFIVQYASNGLLAAYADVIATWDEWVTFVRLLVLRSSACKWTQSIEDTKTQQ